MSLGWQTESALLPSRAKRIQVADKTMVGLRSVVLQQEQQRELRRGTDASLAAQRHLRGFSAKLTNAQAQPDDKKRKRSESDDEADDGDRRAEAARRALEAKAKLYDALRDRQTAPVNSEANALVACAAAGALVDFDGAARHSDAARTRAGSPPREDAPALCSARAEGRVVAGPPQFRWSTGRRAVEPVARDAAADDPTRSFLAARRSEQTLRQLTDSVLRQNSDRDEATTDATGPATSGVSQGARVKSQWERQLGDDAKLLAQAVHRETEQLRSAASASLDAAPASAHEERLRLLQQKRERLQAQQARRRGES